MNSRPIDILNKAKGKSVVIKLKNKSQITGTVQAFDMHINMWIDDAEMTDVDGNITKMGKTLVRGDSIIYVSPVQ